MSAAWFVCDTPTKGSLSSLKLFNLLLPVYFPSSLSLFLPLAPLCFNVKAHQRGEKLCFVLRGSRSGKTEGGALCVNPLARGHVMSVKGIKTYHKTNLSVTPTTVLRSLLHYLPPRPFHFSTDVFVIREQRGPGQEATRHRSWEISSACRPLVP